jgi:GT2 family glycosyltransferase
MTQPATDAAPSVSVIIAAFADERWTDLVQAVDSVLVQSHPARETIVVIDHNAKLFSKAKAELSGVRVLDNVLAQGASGARNTGVAISTSEVVAFMDDDATADHRWLEHLITPFEHSAVIGVGGRLEPAWSSRRPKWFAPEFDWVVGASYRGMPEQVAPIRNVWSGNMAIRREVFDAIGGFRLSFGKTGSRSRPEDTDLCLRASNVREGTYWVYHPEALAHHKVPAAREQFRFFVRRCFAEGQGKADLCALVDRSTAISSEVAYARTVLPKGVALGLGEAFRGDPMGAARSGVIMLGLAAAGAGMTSGRLRQRRSRSRRSATSGSIGDPAARRFRDLGNRTEGADAHSR